MYKIMPDLSLQELVNDLSNINEIIKNIHLDLSLNLNELISPLEDISNITFYLKTIHDVPADITDLLSPQPPVITLLGNVSISLEVFSAYTDAGATATDSYDGDLTSSIVTVNPVDISTVGQYIITYDVSDSYGTTVSVTRTVNVVDTTAPTVINGLTDLSFEVNENISGFNFLAGVTASDAYDDFKGLTVTISHETIDITSVGTISMVYTATDSNDNSLNATRTVAVADNTSPTITLIGNANGDNHFEIEVFSTYDEFGASATDNYDSSITVNSSGTVDISTVGVYYITYTASDAAGNPAIPKTRQVTVVDTTAPTVINGLTDLSFEVNENISGFNFLAGVTASDTYDDFKGLTVTISHETIDITSVGIISMVYTATDSNDNSLIATRTVAVVDTTPPVIHGAIDLSFILGTVITDALLLQGVTATDNYDTNLNINVNYSSIISSTVGTYDVSYSVTDDAGKEAIETITVTMFPYHPEIDGGGWILVRRIQANGTYGTLNYGNAKWHPLNDNLGVTGNAIEVYGYNDNAPNTPLAIDYNDPDISLADLTFSRDFETACPGYNQFLFWSNDDWLVTTPENIYSGSFYSNQNRWIELSSQKNYRHQKKWYFRTDDLPETQRGDPWISVENHTDDPNRMVYAEMNGGDHQGNWHTYNIAATGANVFIRKIFKPQSNQELKDAVNLWCSDVYTALTNYGHISMWNTSNITDMSNLFQDKTTFNDNINDWNVSNVTNMSGMFSSANDFNQPLYKWNTSNVTNMSRMFRYATNFNQDISSWNVSNVTDMNGMFENATSFNQNISSWDVSNVTDFNNMFLNTASLSDNNKLAIHDSFSTNSAWNYNWTDPFVNISTNDISNGTVNNITPITFSFTISESVSTFDISDISINNGYLTDFIIDSSTNYSVKFTPLADGSCSLQVLANEFADDDGFMNSESNVAYNWVHDSIVPVITLLGNANGDIHFEIEVFSTYDEFGAYATDNYDSSITVNSSGTVDISTVGVYYITYTATDAAGNQANPKIRQVTVVDTVAPQLSLIGDNPYIWYNTGDISYVDLGINITDNTQCTTTINTDMYVNNPYPGTYTYTYNISDVCGNSNSISRTVHVLDYTVISSLPTIDISGDVSNNVAVIMNKCEGTTFNRNNEILLSDDFIISFENLGENYRVPIKLLKDMYSNEENIVVYVYGFVNEDISLQPFTDSITYELPFITSSLQATNLVNVVLNNSNNYKLIILDGNHRNTFDNRIPSLNVSGNTSIAVAQNSTFTDPASSAINYLGNDITSSVNTYTDLSTAIVGDYELLYLATDASGFQASQIINVNVSGDLQEPDVVFKYERSTGKIYLKNETIVTGFELQFDGSINNPIVGNHTDLESVTLNATDDKILAFSFAGNIIDISTNYVHILDISTTNLNLDFIDSSCVVSDNSAAEITDTDTDFISVN